GKVGGLIAGALRSKHDGSGSSFTFTRALGEVGYEAPSIAGVLRPALRARVQLTDNQREDLNLESFMFTRLEAGVHILFLPIPQVRASLGGGVQRRLLYSLEPAAGRTPVFPSDYDVAETRPYGQLSLELTFDPESIRRDRH